MDSNETNQWNDRRAKTIVLVVMSCLLVITLLISLSENMGFVGKQAERFVHLVIYVGICGLIVAMIGSTRVQKDVRLIILLMIMVGFLPTLLRWTHQIRFLDTFPILGRENAAHVSLKTIFSVLWVFSPFALIYTLLRTTERAHQQLEQNVIDRTRELSETNRRLNTEIRDRIQAENELDQARRNLEVVVAARSNQLREAQSQLVRQERLSALGKMASGIAHELNNTLSPVVAFSDLLKRADNLSPEQAEWVAYIAQSADDAARVVDSLKKFHGGQSDEHRKVVELAPLIEQVIEMTRPCWRDAARTEGKRIDIDLQLDDTPRVWANPVELRQVLINVVFNAAESIVGNGTITIRLASESDVVIEVRDTGCGMTAAALERCFEPFYTEKAGGTGLGLSVCHGLIHDHGGTLTVESQLGVGTVFTIRLPMSHAAAKRSDRPTSSSLPVSFAGSLKCLYVDDNELLRKSFLSICEANDVDVEVVSSAEEALLQIAATSFDVVITDLSMDGMDGVDLLQEMHQRKIDTPVVLLTGWLETKIAERLKGCIRPDMVLAKPATSLDYQNVFAWYARPVSSVQ